MYFPNLLELSLMTVLAFPNASSNGFTCGQTTYACLFSYEILIDMVKLPGEAAGLDTQSCYLLRWIPTNGSVSMLNLIIRFVSF